MLAPACTPPLPARAQATAWRSPPPPHPPLPCPPHPTRGWDPRPSEGAGGGGAWSPLPLCPRRRRARTPRQGPRLSVAVVGRRWGGGSPGVPTRRPWAPPPPPPPFPRPDAGPQRQGRAPAFAPGVGRGGWHPRRPRTRRRRLPVTATVGRPPMPPRLAPVSRPRSALASAPPLFPAPPHRPTTRILPLPSLSPPAPLASPSPPPAYPRLLPSLTQCAPAWQPPLPPPSVGCLLPRRDSAGRGRNGTGESAGGGGWATDTRTRSMAWGWDEGLCGAGGVVCVAACSQGETMGGAGDAVAGRSCAQGGGGREVGTAAER